MLIQKLRLHRGWSQEQLATVTGLSVRTIQRIEGGQTASLESLKALAAVFEVDLTALQETDMPNPAAAVTSPAEAEEALAFAHVRRVKRFYVHLARYVVIIAGLFVVNVVTYPHYIWAVWPALGWGIGLAFHGLSTFDLIPFFGAEWERRQVEKRLGRPL